MKTIIAGSHTRTGPYIVQNAIRDSGFPITELVRGRVPDVDTLAEQWAEQHGIPVMRFPPEWKRYGQRAGPIRNKEMAAYAEALIAVWDWKSRGTKDMIRQARKHRLQAFVYYATPESDTFQIWKEQQRLCSVWV